jgi:hypothetical protein
MYIAPNASGNHMKIILSLMATVIFTVPSIFSTEVIDFTNGSISTEDTQKLGKLAMDYYACLKIKDYDGAIKFISQRQQVYYKESLSSVVYVIPDEYEIGIDKQDGIVSFHIVNNSLGEKCELVDGKWFIYSPDIDKKYKLK